MSNRRLKGEGRELHIPLKAGMQNRTHPSGGQIEIKVDGGGLRHNAGKLRFDLIPADVMREVARVFTHGATKYAPRNWERGMAYSNCQGCHDRHVNDWQIGNRVDAESKCHPLAHAIVNLMFMLAYDLRGMDHLNDVEPYLRKFLKKNTKEKA